MPFDHSSFLRILWDADALTKRELSERAGVMEPTTFTAIKSMEALGYVTRKHLPHNRKNVYVHLTPKGPKLKSVLVPLAEATNQVSTRRLKTADLATTRPPHALRRTVRQPQAGANMASISRRIL